MMVTANLYGNMFINVPHHNYQYLQNYITLFSPFSKDRPCYVEFSSLSSKHVDSRLSMQANSVRSESPVLPFFLINAHLALRFIVQSSSGKLTQAPPTWPKKKKWIICTRTVENDKDQGNASSDTSSMFYSCTYRSKG